MMDVSETIRMRVNEAPACYSGCMGICHAPVQMRFAENSDPLVLAHMSQRSKQDMWRNIACLSRNASPSALIRDKIDEITLCGDYLSVRSSNGLCAIYHQSGEFVKYINEELGEVIRSVHFNNARREIIKISVTKADEYQSLHCFALSADGGGGSRPIFEQFMITYPGFVELDSLNGTVIVHEGGYRYHLIALETYEELMKPMEGPVSDMKVAQGALLKIEQANQIELKITFIQGEHQAMVSIPLQPFRRIEVVDRHESNVIVKQVGTDIMIYDLDDLTAVTLEGTASLTSVNVMFLYKAKRFMLFMDGKITVYMFSGERLFDIAADRPINQSPIVPGSGQQYLVATSQTAFDQWVYVFHIFTGELILEAYIPPATSCGHHITSVAFDEERGLLVIGDACGNVMFWG